MTLQDNCQFLKLPADSAVAEEMWTNAERKMEGPVRQGCQTHFHIQIMDVLKGPVVLECVCKTH